MTLPDERTRAVINARLFLTRLSSPYFDDGIKRIPATVRQEARRLLRHYPTALDIALMEFDKEEAMKHVEK